MKRKKYYIIWIEGLEYKCGEKIMGITDKGFTYTLDMTKALRIREKDIPLMKDLMQRFGIAQWVITESSSRTFIPTSYAPKGTLYKFTK